MAKREYLDSAGLKQVLSALGDRMEDMEGLPRFYFPEKDIDIIAESTVVAPKRVVWNEAEENFCALSELGVYFREWPGMEKWINPRTGEPYRDRLYLVPGAALQGHGIYTFVCSVQPQRLALASDVPEAIDGTDGADGVAFWVMPSLPSIDLNRYMGDGIVSARAFCSFGSTFYDMADQSEFAYGMEFELMAGENVIESVSGVLSGDTVDCWQQHLTDGRSTHLTEIRITLYVEDDVAAMASIPIFAISDGKDGANGKDGADGCSFSANLMVNTDERIEGTFDADGDNMIIKRECAVHMVKGETYTISARTNAAGFLSGTLNSGPGTEGCALLLCHSEHGAAPGYWETVSAPGMATDGSTGHTLVWNKPTGDYYLRVNFYLSGTWWAEKVKVERGAVAHPQWTPSEDEMNPSGKIAALEAELEELRMLIQLLRDNVTELQDRIG